MNQEDSVTFTARCGSPDGKHHSHLSEEEIWELVVQGVEEYGEEAFKELYTSSHKVPVSEAEAERLFFRG